MLNENSYGTEATNRAALIIVDDADEKMRSSYSKLLSKSMQQLRIKEPRQIIDLGCASGLSSLELSKTFPDAQILGIDLSPFFLAVAIALQEARRKV